MISIVAALGENRVIGKDNELLWKIPEDLKRFKALTMGHPLIMGRKTFESIGRPLPGRTNIVVTRDRGWSAEGVIIAHSLEEAIKTAQQRDADVFVIGGGQLYAQALPRTDRLYLTVVEDEKEGDTYFPPYESSFTQVLSDERRHDHGLSYRWVTLER